MPALHRFINLLLLLMAVLLANGRADAADVVYKVVMPDGTVVYSDRPPADNTKVQTLAFSNLPSSPLPQSAILFRAEMEKSLKARAAQAQLPQPRGVRLYTAQWCPHCKLAKAYLTKRGVRFTEYDIDTESGMRSFVQASGGGGIPLLVAAGGRALGYSPQQYDQILAVSSKP